MSESTMPDSAYNLVGLNKGVQSTVCQEANNIINGQRLKDYGGVTESFQQIADFWSTYLSRNVVKAFPDGQIGNMPVVLLAEDVANMMILMKISRAQNGYHRDSYVDIAGYAGCAEKIKNNE